MKITFFLSLNISIIFCSLPALAELKIIQEEKISFESCLLVIEKSSEKLSIRPEISNPSDKKRDAVFKLSDGILKITCDGELGILKVLTEENQ